MSTSNPTVPPRAGDPRTRGDALGIFCDCLMDIVEELHGMEGTQWAAELHTDEEREASLIAWRAIFNMMATYGRTRDPFVNGDHEPA